jgi:hypothetical protein
VDAPFSNVVPGLMSKPEWLFKLIAKMKIASQYAPVSCFQFHRSIFKVVVLDRSIKAGMVIQRVCLR